MRSVFASSPAAMPRAIPLVLARTTMQQGPAMPRSLLPRWPGFAPGRTLRPTSSTPTSGASPPATGRPPRASQWRSTVRIGRPTGSAIPTTQRASSSIRRYGRRPACPTSNPVRQRRDGLCIGPYPARISTVTDDPSSAVRATRRRSPFVFNGIASAMRRPTIASTSSWRARSRQVKNRASCRCMIPT